MYNKVNELVKALENLGYSALVTPVYKGDVEYTGVSIDIGLENIRPTLYVESYDTSDVLELTKQMVSTINEIKSEKIPDISDISNWNSSKEKLRICVEPVSNTDDVVKRNFLDLQMVVRIIVAENGGGLQSAKVTQALMNSWGISEDELFIKATENTEKEICIGNMLDTLFGNRVQVSIDEFEPNTNNDDTIMFVFTNKIGINGAGGFACKDVLKKLADKFNSGFYILPSSIHELLVIPMETDNKLTRFSFTEMVQEVNAKEVRPEERLSNHCYYYNKVTEEITY